VAEINNTPAYPGDIAIECSKLRKCGWKGMESDMHSVPDDKIKGAKLRICPKCGCDSYFRRDIDGETE